MAGFSNPGEAPDNPVPLNVTAMVDIIFCLSIFFLSAFHFRQAEGKMEFWLPRDAGVKGDPPPLALEEIRIRLDLEDERAGGPPLVTRRVGARPVGSDEELRAALQALLSSYVRAGMADVRAIIDSDPLVPWRDVVDVLDLCRGEGLRRLEFAAARP